MSRYDLFRLKEESAFRLKKESAVWIGTAETLQEANIRASELTDCRECLVLDSLTGEKTVVKTGQDILERDI
jgi:hypothetical protein